MSRGRRVTGLRRRRVTRDVTAVAAGGVGRPAADASVSSSCNRDSIRDPKFIEIFRKFRIQFSVYNTIEVTKLPLTILQKDKKTNNLSEYKRQVAGGAGRAMGGEDGGTGRGGDWHGTSRKASSRRARVEMDSESCKPRDNIRISVRNTIF